MSDVFAARVSRAVVAAFVLAFVAHGFGAPLVPGGAFLTPPEPDPTGGAVVATTGAVPFASPPGPGQFSGTLTTTVITGDPSNPLGGLTFTYRLTNDAVSVNSIGRLTTIDYSGYLTDASYQVPAAGLPSTSTDRSAGTGTIIGWSFTGTPLGLGRLNPGSTSALLVVQTNAINFEETLANVIDGSVVQVASLSPQQNVPEPASLGLLAIGGIALRRRKR